MTPLDESEAITSARDGLVAHLVYELADEVPAEAPDRPFLPWSVQVGHWRICGVEGRRLIGDDDDGHGFVSVESEGEPAGRAAGVAVMNDVRTGLFGR